MGISNLFFSQAVKEVDVTQALSMNKAGGLLLDVREANEFSDAQVPNSVLIPLGQIQNRLNELAAFKEKPIAVICRSGMRSATAVQILQAAGYSQASNVRGGIIAWDRAGLPILRRNM